MARRKQQERKPRPQADRRGAEIRPPGAAALPGRYEPPVTVRRWTTAGLAAGVLGAVWLYVWFWVVPPLRYCSAAPVFLLQGDFFLGHLGRPGGALDYVAAAIAQLDFKPSLGALASTVMIGATVWVWGMALVRCSRCHPAMPLAPALLLLVLAGQYDAHLPAVGLGVLVGVTAFAGWLTWRPRRALLRYLAFWGAAGLLFYLAGPFPTLLFVALGCVGEIRQGGVSEALCCGLAALLVPAGLMLSSEPSVVDVLSAWGSGVPLAASVLLHAIFPLTLALGGRLPRQPVGNEVRPQSAAGGAGLSGLAKGSPRTIRWGWAAGGAALGIGVLALTSDVTRRTLLRIEWAAQQGRWDRAIEAGRQLRLRPGPATRLALNRALFHAGRLTTDLFCFPQQKGAELLPSLRDGLKVCAPLAETLLDLGQVSLAEHFAHEAIENIGERPHLLWLLARINVLQDRPRAARVFLNRLRQIPFHRNRADARLRAIEADPTLAAEPDISRVRALRVNTDVADSGHATEFLLRQSLQSNPRNRMAVEYLVAQWLLADQVDTLVQNLGLLNDAGIWETPRPVEEGLLAYLASKSDEKAEIAGRRVRPEVVRRYREFRARLSGNGGRVAGIESALAREFGDTFWFYQLFGATFGAAPPRFTGNRK